MSPDKEPINIEDIEREAQKTAQHADEVTSILEEKFVSDNFLKTMGSLLLGSDTNENGEPWSMRDMVSWLQEARAQGEVRIRRSLSREMMYLLESQDGVIGGADEDTQIKLSLTRDFIAAVLMRVIKSEEKIADPYPVTDTETRYEAELLEVIRRSVFNPTYIIVEGVAKGSISSLPSYYENYFWLDREREMEESGLKELDSYKTGGERFYQAQQARTRSNVDNLTSEGWVDVANLEEMYIIEYLHERAKRFSDDRRDSYKFWSSVEKGGKPMLSDSVKSSIKSSTELAINKASEIENLESLRDIRSWIKQELGEEATFNTLLEALS